MFLLYHFIFLHTQVSLDLIIEANDEALQGIEPSGQVLLLQIRTAGFPHSLPIGVRVGFWIKATECSYLLCMARRPEGKRVR